MQTVLTQCVALLLARVLLSSAGVCYAVATHCLLDKCNMPSCQNVAECSKEHAYSDNTGTEAVTHSNMVPLPILCVDNALTATQLRAISDAVNAAPVEQQRTLQLQQVSRSTQQCSVHSWHAILCAYIADHLPCTALPCSVCVSV